MPAYPNLEAEINQRRTAMPYENRRTEFVNHPEGQFEGIIYKWKDQGWKPSPYGSRHRAFFGIESINAFMDDGRPFVINEFLPVAFGDQSILQKRRVEILGRALTEVERETFNPKEIIGTRIAYQVVYRDKPGGGVWVNINAIMRLQDQSKGSLVNEIQIDESIPNGFEEPSSQPNPDTYDGRVGEITPEYFVRLVTTACDNGLVESSAAEAIISWASNGPDTSEMEQRARNCEDLLVRSGIPLPGRPLFEPTSTLAAEPGLPL